jgi:hypothetical protein
MKINRELSLENEMDFRMRNRNRMRMNRVSSLESEMDFRMSPFDRLRNHYRMRNRMKMRMNRGMRKSLGVYQESGIRNQESGIKKRPPPLEGPFSCCLY